MQADQWVTRGVLLALLASNKMRALVCVAVVVGCGSSAQSSRDPGSNGAEPSQPPEAPTLSDAQKECRSRELQSISTLGRAMDHGCANPTMRLALTAFDFGAASGQGEAHDYIAVNEHVCICSREKCSDDEIQEMLARTQRVMVTDDGKRERDGVSNIIEVSAGSSCVDAEAAGLVFKSGFRCGFKVTMETEREIERADFRNIFHDETKADALIAACAHK
ncbi:MAG: hypothetical protein ABI591_09680 [Kofleriaceae bacterium]